MNEVYIDDGGRVQKERRSCPYSDCQEPRMAARHAVQEVFAIMGVDIYNPKEVANFQDSLRFGGAMLKLANKSMAAMVTTIAVLLVGSMVVGIAYKFKIFSKIIQ